MKKLDTTILILLLSIGTVFTAFSQNKTPYPKATETQIKQIEENILPWVLLKDSLPMTLEERMKFYGVNGLSIAVIKDYKMVWAKGYGFADAAEKRIVDENTLFQAASISKSLNAVGVLKLVQDKKIDLDTDINNFLKSWKFPYDSVSKGKKITVANLLSHTGGTTVHGFPGYTNKELLPKTTDILNGKKPANTEAVRSETAPGIKFNYSGGGTTITQQIVADITGQAYDDYMWKTVLKPIGMMNSSYTQPPLASKKKLLATGYTAEGIEIEGKYHIYPEQAAAGLWTNPTDLCKYIIELQLSYIGKSNKVLNRNTARTMLTPYLPKDEAALGVFISKEGSEEYFLHGGSNEGFRCQYLGSIEGGNGVVVMLNSDNGGIMEEIINSVATVYNWKDFYKPVVKTVIKVPETILDTYIGDYQNEETSFSIVKENGALWMKFPWATQKMYFTSNDEFFRYENKNTPRFIKDVQGKVSGIQFSETFFTPKVK
ncbi:serine hydrolase [Flavobacterium hauense]